MPKLIIGGGVRVFKEIARADDGAAADIVVVRTERHLSTLDDIDALVDVVSRDFPGVTRAQMHLAIYDGDIKGTYGLEFNIPAGSLVPADYVPIPHCRRTVV